MRKLVIGLMTLTSVVVLAACGGAAAQSGSQPAATGGGAAAGASTASAADSAVLNQSYKDALPVVSQLVLGSLKLDADAAKAGADQSLAIDKDEAGKLLPLWQAYESLGNSSNTAQAELDALVSQIQETMHPEQIQAIAGMQLTANSIGDVLQAQGPGFFGGGFGNRNGNGGATSGNGTARGGFDGPPGGFPGGPGGIPGGGPGGVPGGFANASPKQRATAIAERIKQDGGQGASFMARGLVNALITSLRLKTGDLTQEQLQAEQQQRAALRWLPVISQATGVTVDDLTGALDGETTLGDVIKAKGGDLAKVQAAMQAALKNNPNLDDKAIQEQIDSVLAAKAAPPQATPQP